MIISVSPSNSLGNALFNHAHLLAAAGENGTRYLNPFFGAHADLFPSTRRDPLVAGLPRALFPAGATPVRRVACAGLRRLARTQQVLEGRDRALPGTRIVASGWASTLETGEGMVLVDREPFCSLARSTPLLLVSGPLFRFEDRDRFVRGWRSHIVRFFRPDRDVVQRAAASAESARRGRTHLLGVHVRRGDYKNFVGGRYFYEWDAYERLMRRIADAWGPDSVAFLVCSNEAIPRGFATGLTWTPGPGDVLGDLEALGACDWIVSPPSTFSGWASFVGGKPRYTIEDLAHVPVPADFLPSEG